MKKTINIRWQLVLYDLLISSAVDLLLLVCSGEKLYEELLVKTEELDETDNSLIFFERDVPLSKEEVERRLEMLKNACETEDDDAIRLALKEVVPTFRKPEEVNISADESDEMQNQRECAVA